MQKLVVIDGNAILHRAYHALPFLNTKDGNPTNAVYGFFSMLIKVIGDLRPEYLIVCFDRKAPTFRKQMFSGYQSKRPTMSDDLVPQIDVVYKALDRAKIKHFGIDGYEADDLIGTISKQAVEKGLEVIILSGDRDLLQLVNPHVLMLAPVVGITNMTLFDVNKVKEKYGLNPLQIIDYKALVGDNSDNYPGVTGIGPKTASNLLQKYESLENLYKNISKLPMPLQQKLATDAEQAAMAKKLATIVLDAPLSFEKEEALLSNMDIENLRQEFERLGFNSIQKRLLDLQPKPIKKEKISKEKNEKDDNQMSLL
ncbi:MAG: 5'-3' exonuclease H3TH domain-containing protein [Patescibacteria group bacterium]